MHDITKVRREIVRRQLAVATKEYVTPRMLRITFHSGELAGFESPSPDDHVKIFLPVSEGAPPLMRDFTPRAWDVATGTLTLDFAMHDHGPAVDWARRARVGDPLSIGGPRGSTVVADDFDWYVLVGDATALPSIGRRLATIRSAVPVHVFALVADEAEHQSFADRDATELHWIYQRETVEEDASRLRAALDVWELPAGDGFVWIATETSIARTLFQYFTLNRKQPREWVKASGYWTADAPADLL